MMERCAPTARLGLCAVSLRKCLRSAQGTVKYRYVHGAVRGFGGKEERPLGQQSN